MIVVFDIDGVIRDVGGSYRRALADTVEHFTGGQSRPSPREIDALKAEGQWNNDWEASQELIARYFTTQGMGSNPTYPEIVTFFQGRYRGEQAQSQNYQDWTGYICQEPLLVDSNYFEALTVANIPWGFFSGATKGSASFVLEGRLGLVNPLLVAMEDAPGKPDPAGLFAVLEALQAEPTSPVIYVGDTVADMYTVNRARERCPDRPWIAVGVLPPHVRLDGGVIEPYRQGLVQAGAAIVLDGLRELTPERIAALGIA
jgi:HAD superfamily phosphatase